MKKIDLNDVKNKMYENLKPSGWANKIKSFILSSDFDKILEYLLHEVGEGRRFTPRLKHVFRAMEECPYDSVKVVIIGQDPYPSPGVADGIAFSCSITQKEQPSLMYMLDEIQNTVYPGQLYKREKDLSKWSNQGVLLINSAFTTTIGKAGTHFEIWKPFMTFLLDTISNDYPDMIYAFLGKQSLKFYDCVSEESIKFQASHPAAAAHNSLNTWNSNDLFNNINERLIGQNKLPITW